MTNQNICATYFVIVLLALLVPPREYKCGSKKNQSCVNYSSRRSCQAFSVFSLFCLADSRFFADWLERSRLKQAFRSSFA